MSDTAMLERETLTGDDGPASCSPRSKGPSRRLPTMATLFGGCFAVFAWAIQLRPLQDNSFLWHLRTGHWILDHGVPRADMFSFTVPGAPWVVQSWLAEALYAGIDSAFGPFGLRVLRGGVSALIAFLVYKLATRLTGERVRAAMITLVALGVSFTLWSERPLLLGVLAMVVLVWAVEVPDSIVGRRPLLTLPLLMWIWANVHGTFALGFAYLAVHLVGCWLDGERPWEGRSRPLLTAGAVALAVCLVNPLGASLLTFPIHLLARGDVLNQVMEWRSPDFHGFIGMAFALWVVVLVTALARRQPRPTRRDILVSVSFLLLGFWALRNLAVVPIVGLVVVARAAAVDGQQDDRRSPVNLVALVLMLLIGCSALSQAAGVKDYDLSTYPVQAMKVLDQQGLLGSELLTTDAWGGYVIHEYWPRQRVFIDDRYDMYPTALAQEYFKLARAAPGWRDILDRHQIKTIVWPNEKPLSQVLDLAPGWRRIHQDKLASVWVRSEGQGS